MFWEIWGLQKLFYEKLIYSQSRTKTSTKTHIAKQNKNIQIIACWYITYIRRNQKKSEKREIKFSSAGRFGLRLWFCWWIHKKFTNLQISVFHLCECFFLQHRRMCICLVRKVVLLVNTQIHITKWSEFYLYICKFLFVAQIKPPRETLICVINNNWHLQIHK